MARPRSARPLRHQVLVRISDEQHEHLLDLLEMDGGTAPELLRTLLTREIERKAQDGDLTHARALRTAREAMQRRRAERADAIVIPIDRGT